MPGAGKIMSAGRRILLASCVVLLAYGALAQPPTSRRVEGNRILTEDGWFARAEVSPPPLPNEVTRAFVIPVREEITEKTYAAIKRKVILCRQEKAELVIIDMDTWGGEVIAALDIARQIKRDLGEVRTGCFINTRAVSAGALIALACNDRLIAPTGVLGDAAPISPGGKIEGVEREKVETVLRNEFKDSAKRGGLPAALAQKIVSWDMEVWLVRHKQTRELQYVLEEEWRGRVEVPPGVSSAPSATTAEWELLRVVAPKGRLLTLDAEEAVRYGFATEIPRAPLDEPLAEALKYYHVKGAPTVLEDMWSETLVEFLTSPSVTALLFFVAILCAYIEINAPGHIVPGIIAVLCFAVIFGSRYLTGLATWWEIGLFVLGLILLGVEVFVLPGFGVTGVLGILFCLVGLIAILVPNAPNAPPLPLDAVDWQIFGDGLLAFGIGVVLAAIAAAVLGRYLHKMPVANRLVLAPVPPVVEPTLTVESAYQRIGPGAVGVVEGMLRPVGKVRFGNDLLDANSEGAIIEPGARVRVLRREGNQIFVERAP